MDLESKIITEIEKAEDDNKLLFFRSGIGQHFKNINACYAVLLIRLSQHHNSVARMLVETKSVDQPIHKDDPLIVLMKSIEIKLDEIETDLKNALIFAKKLNKEN
jgi:hypothetical protein